MGSPPLLLPSLVNPLRHLKYISLSPLYLFLPPCSENVFSLFGLSPYPPCCNGEGDLTRVFWPFLPFCFCPFPSLPIIPLILSSCVSSSSPPFSARTSPLPRLNESSSSSSPSLFALSIASSNNLLCLSL